MVLKKAVFLIIFIFSVYAYSFSQESSSQNNTIEQLHKINTFKKELNTLIDSINNNNKVNSINILDKAQELYDLTTQYHEMVLNNIVSSQKISNNTKLVSNILLNSEDILKNNKTYKQPIDSVQVCKDIIEKTSVCIKSLKMAQDINLDNSESKHLFNQPINIELLCKHYDISQNTIQSLISDTTTDSQSNAKVETIQKGHSPFTNTYDEFIYFTDSLSKTEEKVNSKINTPKKEEQKPGASSLQDNFNDYSNISEDSLFLVAIEDSLFPHDLIKRYDINSLKRYWTIYKNQWNPEVMNAKTSAFNNENYIDSKNLVASSDIKHNFEETKTQEKQFSSIQKHTTTNSNKENHKQIAEELTTSDTTHSLIGNYDNNNTPILRDQETANMHNNNGIYYYIQLAASRTPIEPALLSVLNEFKDSVTIRNEEGWYKYQINKTESYIEALNKAEKLNTKGAFIVAYKSNEKQVLWKTIKKQNNNKTDRGLLFVVQVSANKLAANSAQWSKLENIAEGKIREIEENGWYKYQLVIGSSYTKALKKWKQIGTKKSFLVAYLNNEKIEMSKAIKIYNSNKTN